MNPQDQKLLDHLSQFVSDHKKNFVEKVLAARTRYVTVVLEDIFQSQNASAVLRTSECMGLQDIHIVENTAKYHLNVRVLKGADKWLTLHRYRSQGVNNTEVCYQRLKRQGYKILLADPAADGTPINEINVDESKIALVFGNELRGVSEYALECCDAKIRVPMYGFTESLNVSVSVAICLNTILQKLRFSQPDIGLLAQEKDHIRLEWFKKIVRRSDILEKEFLKTIA
ncbi:MAG TPA: RNA methyltransferase [Chryseosolibacter sp.]|nr:RNA methyltransferase [Chryseosolibacter sp.]